MTTRGSHIPAGPGPRAWATDRVAGTASGGLVGLTATLGLIAITVAIQVSVNTTAIADDYTFVSAISGTDTLTFLHGYWAGLTDRYADAILMAATLRVFGAAALQITPILLIGLMCVFATRLASALGLHRSGRAVSVAIGILATASILITAPSLFDTVGWFTAVAIYLAGVVGAVGVAARATRLATTAASAPPRRVELIASVLAGLVAAGFTELIGIEIALAALLATLHVRATGARRPSLEGHLLAIAAGALAGVAVIFLGPGSQARAGHVHATIAVRTLVHDVADNFSWLHYEMGWRLLPAAGLGLIVWRLTRPRLSPLAIRWMLIWSTFLFFVPLLVVAVGTGYSGAPLATSRAAFVASASMAGGTAVVAFALAACTAAVSRRASAGLPVAAIAAVAVGVAGFVSAGRPVIAAEQLRAHAVAARAGAIRHQLERRRRAIWVMPAPLIDPTTGAYDLIFGNHYQFDYVLAALRMYYRVPAATPLHVVWSQPRRYCVAGVEVRLLGVHPCT